MIGIPDSKIQIINNGISDTPETIVFTKAPTKEFRLLYVGSIIPSKGLFYILEAIRKLKEQGYSISLAVAGKGPQGYVKQLKQVNADIPIQFMGNIPFNKLKNYYQKCNAGIIASLQEQCSYAAIEMSMFGLPLIVTAVDGLDEMFTDEENALKIAVKFSKVYGLSIDTDNMASQLKRLIDDENLRNRLGINARKLYKEKFSLNDMVRKTVAIYNKLIN